MPDPRRGLGDLGERLAERHLLAKGYRILERNFRIREGEIDLIAEVGGTLVFVEVRARRGARMGTAIESVTPAKQRRLVALAEAYGQVRDDLPRDQRIDVIALDLSPEGKVLSIEHVEGAVWAE
ncbi:MAG: YraN family protein [Dehalococcoidia bacterium]